MGMERGLVMTHEAFDLTFRKNIKEKKIYYDPSYIHQ